MIIVDVDVFCLCDRCGIEISGETAQWVKLSLPVSPTKHYPFAFSFCVECSTTLLREVLYLGHNPNTKNKKENRDFYERIMNFSPKMKKLREKLKDVEEKVNPYSVYMGKCR